MISDDCKHPRERQVELVRQVEIFESEMIEDTDEIAQLPNLGTHHGAHLDQSGQAELAERTAAAHLSAVVGNALEAAVSSPLQLLQVRSPLIALDCIDCPRGGR
jgi:hypothetical protein